jgi:hypothetical protein
MADPRRKGAMGRQVKRALACPDRGHGLQPMRPTEATGQRSAIGHCPGLPGCRNSYPETATPPTVVKRLGLALGRFSAGRVLLDGSDDNSCIKGSTMRPPGQVLPHPLFGDRRGLADFGAPSPGQEPSAATGQRMTASIALFSALGWLGRRGAVLRSSTISAPIS